VWLILKVAQELKVSVRKPTIKAARLQMIQNISRKSILRKMY
jgi:hypothetical protein